MPAAGKPPTTPEGSTSRITPLLAAMCAPAPMCSGDAALASDHDSVADDRPACDADLSADDAVAPQLNVVGDLDETIEHAAGPYHGVAGGAAVDGAVGTDERHPRLSRGQVASTRATISPSCSRTTREGRREFVNKPFLANVHLTKTDRCHGAGQPIGLDVSRQDSFEGCRSWVPA